MYNNQMPNCHQMPMQHGPMQHMPMQQVPMQHGPVQQMPMQQMPMQQVPMQQHGPTQQLPMQHGPQDIKDMCWNYMNYHVVGQMADGSQMEGILEDVDDEGVTMLVPEDVEEDERVVGVGVGLGGFGGYGGYGRRRFRRFRRRRFPYNTFAFPFIFPFPYFY